MPVTQQPAYQPSLLDAGDPTPEFGVLTGATERIQLDATAWIDVRRSWLSGSDALFTRLVDDVPWKAERRRMYDRVVDVPRLVRFYDETDELPDPALVTAREELSDHYAVELGERFATAGLCYYRSGDDSVAWHGDTIGRSRTEDTMVAILSLGAVRSLAFRRRGGGEPSRRFPIGHGDLVVMGGACQRTWEHAVPKTARPVGPRISVQFRTVGVR